MEKLALSVKEAAAAIGVSDRKVWELTKVEGFPSVRLGGRVVIPALDLQQWLSELARSGKSIG